MKDINKLNIINRKETIRYLGYKKGEPDEIMLHEIELCEQEFLKVVEPKYHYQIFDLLWEGDRLMHSDGSFEFPGMAIKKHLKGSSRVAFSAATLSSGVDELIDKAQREDMLMALIYDAIANASIEEVRALSEQEIAKTNEDYDINWQFGIGYGDLPLNLQPQFLAKIDAKETIGLTVNERNLLIPLKSVTGFVGLTRKDGSSEQIASKQQGCLLCPSKDSCMYQKTE